MSIRKRKVFYLSGFDPRGAHFYHQTYREAAQSYSALSGEAVDVSKRNAQGWQVHNTAQSVHTDYHFLRWDDIVRRAWMRNPLPLLWRALLMYKDYFLHTDRQMGRKIFRMRYRTVLFPLIVLVLLPLLLAGLFSVFMPPIIALCLALLAVPFIVKRVKALWLLRFYIFNHRYTTQGDAELDAQLRAFAAEIAASFNEDWDEILLICHSNGGILAVPLMNHLFALRPNLPARFHLVTMGQLNAAIACLQSAVHFREALAQLATQDFSWVDINFPPDFACVPLSPFADMPHRCRLITRSPQFFRYYDAAHYQKLRRNKYLLHFAYLQTAHSLSPLNVIAITAGSKPLIEQVKETA
jgi:hypothetical protein